MCDPGIIIIIIIWDLKIYYWKSYLKENTETELNKIKKAKEVLKDWRRLKLKSEVAILLHAAGPGVSVI